ncbi:MAG: glycosyltransferase family 2 protein [Pseudonocardia sp.]
MTESDSPEPEPGPRPTVPEPGPTEPEPGPRPAVSVVVPTRDRPDRLAVCLAALRRQTVPALEIVVVDDASRDAAAVAAVVAAVPGARLVRGQGRGPAAARNAGVAAARAPIVCLTDDDCEPVPGWAAALAARIGSESTEVPAPASTEGPAPASTEDPVPAAAAAGPTRNGRPGSVCAAAAQAIASHLAEATMDADTGRMRFAPTSNLACATAVLRAVPFDERYPLAAGEDRDWCARLLAAGHPLLFAPEALVRHHQELTPAGFWRQQVRYGRGGYRFRADHRTLLRPEPAGFYTGLLRRGFAEGPRAGLLVGLAQVATAVGMAREAIRQG